MGKRKEGSLSTDHYPLDPDSLGPYVDPDAPTVPTLPAYHGYWPGPTIPERQVSLFERAMDRFSRLSLGARVVCIGCAALVTFCLVSPYVDVAENTLSQAISYGTSAAPSSSAAHPSGSAPSGSAHTTKSRASTTNVPTRRDGALTWSASTAAPSSPADPNSHANVYAKLHAHTHWGADAAAQHHGHGHGRHGG